MRHRNGTGKMYIQREILRDMTDRIKPADRPNREFLEQDISKWPLGKKGPAALQHPLCKGRRHLGLEPDGAICCRIQYKIHRDPFYASMINCYFTLPIGNLVI